MNDRTKPYLTGIFIENFQSIRSPAYIRLTGITMLYGPNSAGKSSVLDALDFIRRISDDDDNNFRIDYLWRTLCSDDTRLGISYHAMPISNDDGARQAAWIEKQINYSSTHLDFFEKLENKEVFFEISQDGHTIKVGVEGKALLEIEGFVWGHLYNEDFTPAISDEEERDAELSGREIRGRLTIHHANPHLANLLPGLQRFYLVASRQHGHRDAVYKYTSRRVTDRIENTQDLQMIFEDHGSSFSIRGIELFDWELTGNRRFGVGKSDDAEKYLLKTDLRKYFDIQNESELTVEQSTRLWLVDQINEISQLIDALIEGLRYQICIAIKHSHVPGNRGVIDSDTPAYATEGYGYSKFFRESKNLKHVELYAEARSEHSKLLKPVFNRDRMGKDFINEALTRYMSSLNGYRVNADVHVAKPKFKGKTRIHPWPSNNENSIVFLNVQDSTGRIFGFQEVGSGISYILPIFTSLWASTLSFVEQPELHLHPAAQSELGDVFVAAKNLGSFSVVESHSEHLLLRILRRIRETTAGKVKDKYTALSCDELKIYYFNPSPGIGTSVFEIRVDRFGELLNRWPGGFFAERDQELFS